MTRLRPSGSAGLDQKLNCMPSRRPAVPPDLHTFGLLLLCLHRSRSTSGLSESNSLDVLRLTPLCSCLTFSNLSLVKITITLLARDHVNFTQLTSPHFATKSRGYLPAESVPILKSDSSGAGGEEGRFETGMPEFLKGCKTNEPCDPNVPGECCSDYYCHSAGSTGSSDGYCLHST